MKRSRLRTLLVGGSMFMLTFSASAQAGSLQEFQAAWMSTNNISQMTDIQYAEMKTAWMQTQQTTPPVRLTPAEQALQDRASENAAEAALRGFPAGFPYKVDTGNPDADEAAYQLAKANWIANNQALYNQMIPAAAPLTEAELQERASVLNNQNN